MSHLESRLNAMIESLVNIYYHILNRHLALINDIDAKFVTKSSKHNELPTKHHELVVITHYILCVWRKWFYDHQHVRLLYRISAVRLLLGYRFVYFGTSLLFFY